jgi:hypothetical protein
MDPSTLWVLLGALLALSTQASLLHIHSLHSLHSLQTPQSLPAPPAPSPSIYNVPSSQTLALQDLYNQTNGSQWTWKTPQTIYGTIWDFSHSDPNPCAAQWQGISCSSNCSFTPCMITGIDLDNYGLNGRLVPSIGNISSLQSLNISNNFNLSGRLFI